ncbi:hypothetical protein INT45_008153 [Circinella minor]|uniref:Uncharacterized protein n=1 Tax=Circinella minor TaxID=1195481 RepID=A0A8H7QZD3_9FUNG|nr:hypothetical protein INT45_008153 [Circinella minor]
MKDIAMSKSYEHPVHSMTIDPEDQIYNDKFNQQDLCEIREHKGIEFDLELPKELHQYLYSYQGINQ